MFLTTTAQIAGKNIERTLGLVQGSTIQTRWIGRDIAALLRTLVGGEIKSYTEMINRAREEATAKMVNEAKAKGANAVIGVRFSTTSVMAGAAEILAYGTAVKLA